jgi:F-type H+-transporting ATPase subunit delta
MKKNSSHEYAAALFEVASQVPQSQQAEVATAFTALLIRNHVIHHADQIIADFIKLSKEHDGTSPVEVTTTQMLSEELKGTLKKVFGSNIEVIEKVDPHILGGIIIKTHDVVLDGSIKTQIERLKTSMIQ